MNKHILRHLFLGLFGYSYFHTQNFEIKLAIKEVKGRFILAVLMYIPSFWGPLEVNAP